MILINDALHIIVGVYLCEDVKFGSIENLEFGTLS